MKLTKYEIVLLLILTLAIFLRFYKLGDIPIGFNDDEAAFGYNAYSVLTTGRDEWGKFLPFPAFESFGDWKLIAYLYLAVLSTAIFGVNEFATRFPSALLGTLSVLITYFLTIKLFEKDENKKTYAIFATFLLAISPWSIIASRNAFESDILVFFISLATVLFLKGLNSKNYLSASVVVFSTSLYVYRSAWLFVPIFTLSLLFFFKDKFKKMQFLKLAFIFTLLALPLAPTVFSFSGQSRFIQESFISGVSRSGIIDDLNSRRGECTKKNNKFVCQLIYNKYFGFTTIYFNNYFDNLSPQTYFTRGNSQGYQSFPSRGLFYTFELPLLAVGTILLVAKKYQAAKVLIPWILIVPIGASFTGVGNPGRLNILMPAPQIIEGFALGYLILKVIKQPAGILLAFLAQIVIFISVAKLLADAFYYFPAVSGQYQRYGYKELFQYLNSQKDDYQQIVVSRRGDDAKQYIHFLFFTKYNPKTYLSDVKRYTGGDGWQVVEKVSNFYFYPSIPPLEKLDDDSLLAVEDIEASFPVDPVKEINYPNGDKLFSVYKVEEIKYGYNK